MLLRVCDVDGDPQVFLAGHQIFLGSVQAMYRLGQVGRLLCAPV